VTSAREEILGRIRAATAGLAAPVTVIPPGSRPEDVVTLFAERVADYRATVVRCTPRTLRGELAAALPTGRIVVPPGLSVSLPDAVVDDGLTAAELDACVAVVTDAAVGIAETGTIVLDHGPGQGRRAITLVPDVHVCIVRADQVVADVPDAMPRLDPAKPLTWISGPSATSDIELDRVEGVHGPRTLHVLLVSSGLLAEG
jgi:L-lactate dehydrogenase complex protein LldG